MRRGIVNRWVAALLSIAWMAAGASAAQASPVDRSAALEAWLTMTEAAQVPTGWTGSVAGCVRGTESADSITATLRTVNALRDFAGVQPVDFDPALNARALASALMMDAGNSLSHTPGPAWPCYSTDGAQAAGSSNLYLGRSGAAAMVGYVDDAGVQSLGHRRWLLNPQAYTMGTGSTGRANDLYVFQSPGAAAPRPAPDVVSWPPAGPVPWALVFDDWSAHITLPGTANVSGARVAVRVDGQARAVTGLQTLEPGYGGPGPTLAWQAAITAADRAGDRTLDVAITGVTVNGVARSFAYQIAAFPAAAPDPVKATSTRNSSGVTVSWPAAAEHGVAVTGYRVVGTTQPYSSAAPVFNLTVSADKRSATAAVPASTDPLWVAVVPISRAGSPDATFDYVARPPTSAAGDEGAGGGGSLGGGGSSGGGGSVGGGGVPPREPADEVTPPPTITSLVLRRVQAGRLVPGRTLRVQVETRGATRIGYRWLRNGRAIRGAISSAYSITRADRGKLIRCRITVSGDGGKAVGTTSSVRVVR